MIMWLSSAILCRMSPTRTVLSEPVSRHVTPTKTILRADVPVGEAMASLRKRDLDQPIVYFYVLDEDEKLVGVVSTRNLLLANPKAKVSDLMDGSVISIPDTMTLEDALEFFAMYRLLAFPVVDKDNKLLGTIDVQRYTEEVLDMTATDRMADLYQYVGFSVEQARQQTAFTGYKSRMPWLFCNMGAGVACAIIAAFFERTLAEVVVIAMFIPLVLTLSESISIQSMTLSFQFLHRVQIAWDAVWKRVRMEAMTALMIGVTSGVVVGLTAILWGKGSAPAAVIGISIIAGMFVSAIAGMGVPVLLHAFRLDAKVASGPVVLMCADVLTTTVYLGLATWMLV
ncbi:MAG: magnesium transporter [Phycisphaerales bacterium]|nr:MAG: magnesium transporter [Phycisphaerales bacterium]